MKYSERRNIKRRPVSTRSREEIDATYKNRTDAAIKKLSSLTIKKICNEYVSGISRTTLSKNYKLANYVVTQILIRNNIRLRELWEARGSASPETKKEIGEEYKKGQTIPQLAIKHDTSESQIHKILNENNIEPRRNRAETAFLVPHYEEIGRRYDEGETSSQLGEEFNTDRHNIIRIVRRLNIKVRTMEESKRCIPIEQWQTVCDRYKKGESFYELADSYSVSVTGIRNIILKHDVKIRSISEARWPDNGLPKEEEESICLRYNAGEDAYLLADEYSVYPSTVYRLLARKKVEIRQVGGLGDSIKHAIDGTGNFEKVRDTCFYIYDLKGFPNHLKPGITFNTKQRSEKRWYKDELFHKDFDCREKAYFLEQAILAETQEEWDCPNAIKEDTKWGGHEEIRLMDIDDLIAIHDYYLNELEDLGKWEFAINYLDHLMTSEQKTKCKLNIQENN